MRALTQIQVQTREDFFFFLLLSLSLFELLGYSKLDRPYAEPKSANRKNNTILDG